MDYLLTDQGMLSIWLLKYGSFAIFGLLALGIIALPVPEETLMVLAGILMANEKLHEIPTIIAAYAGSMCGITVSYLLGRVADNFIIHKFGRWVGLSEQKIKIAHHWFARFGKWTLVIGYYIPGIRHLTGFAAGATSLEYKKFALFAYSGAFIWVSTFLSIGYFLGDYWIAILEKIEYNLTEIVIVVVVLVTLFFVVRHFYNKIKKRKHTK